MISAEIKTMEHLGLVSGMIDELGIVEIIDELIEQDLEERKVSIGLLVKAMILNGLGFANRQLYLFPEFFENKPVKELLGEGVEASNLNDKVLGRALDKMYEFGITGLYSLIVNQSLKKVSYVVENFHIDSTSFKFYGNKYNSEDDEEQIQITQGYSKDHRPDLNQVVLNLICENKNGIPLAMKALSGNKVDKIGFEEVLREHISLLKSVPNGVIVADSALYTKNNLQSLKEQKIHWITRVPETIKDVKEIFKDINLENMTMFEIEKDGNKKKYPFLLKKNNYGGIEQNWIVVYSESKDQRLRKNIESKYKKLLEKDRKQIKELEKESFFCEEDAVKKANKIKKSLKTILLDIEILKNGRYKKAGKPPKNILPDFFEYKIGCKIKTIPLNEIEKDLGFYPYFILSSNDMTKSAEDIIKAYKNQYTVERGFRFLKSKEFSASTFFVKKPERIESLLMVMTLCLFVYSLLEAKIKRKLLETEPFFPNQKRKPTQKPTARWVFQTFIDTHLFVMEGYPKQIANLKKHHIRLINILGDFFIKYYFFN